MVRTLAEQQWQPLAAEEQFLFNRLVVLAGPGLPSRGSELDRLFPPALRQAEAREAEEALKESEDRYRDLVENSEDLICTHDLEGRFLSVNRALVRRLGYERAEEFLGRTLSNLLALSTQESLGVNSLSLAPKSGNSILQLLA